MGGSPLATAFVRSVMQAIATGGLTFFTIYGQTDDWKLIISATGVAVFTVLAGRFGVEGSVDNRAAIKQAAGDVVDIAAGKP